MKILIALPAFNEEKVIRETISSLHKAGYKNLLVVNDGSTDETSSVAKNLQVQVVSHFKNRGLGVAIRTAIRFARENNFDILVTFDADGQHDAADIKRVTRPIIEKKVDIVIGTRDFSNNSVPVIRQIILKLSNLYTWILFGAWTKDSQSGFRAFGRRAIENLDLKTEKMEVSSEIFSEIKSKNLHFTEVPIHVIYTKYSLSKGQRNSNMFNIGFKLFLKLIH